MGEVVGVILTVALLSRFDLVLYVIARITLTVR